MPYYNAYYANGYATATNPQAPNWLQQPVVNNQPNIQVPQQPIAQAIQNGNGIVWVASEGDAMSYPVAFGQSQLMMDRYKSYAYIKSVDQSGMAMPLRKFKMIEESFEQAPQEQQPINNPEPQIDTSRFVTWDELEKRLAEQPAKKPVIGKSLTKKVEPNADK